MSAEGFINYLSKSDSIVVFFEQKSQSDRFFPHEDAIYVGKDITAATGKQNIAFNEINVQPETMVLKQITQHYINGFDQINVLDSGSNFQLEVYLNEQNPNQKFARIVQTTFNPNVHWS